LIGIVVVSHSPALAEAAVELALQMVPGDRPPIAIAAGAGDGVIGTDATRVAAAIEEVASPDGVLVFMDLGSALMSTELALEFVADPDLRVKLTSAPFVEGLLAGIVRASGGASLDEVEEEARGALAAKSAQLGDDPAADQGVTSGPSAVAAGLSVDLELANPSGLHARPASLIAAAAMAADAKTVVENLRTGSGPVRADSSIALMSLGARTGDSIRVSSTGPGAAVLLDKISALVADGFGEL
jgi:dihydroxyacetone kinase phosphotransfer subunit